MDRGKLYTLIVVCVCCVVYDRTVPRLLGLCFVITRCCPPVRLVCSAHQNNLVSPFPLDLGLIPCHRLIRYFVFFAGSQIIFFERSSFFTCTACPVDPLQRLFFLFKDHCHLVGCPSLRCHRYRGLSFTHRRWWPRDQSPVSGCPLTEPGSRDGEWKEDENRRHLVVTYEL